MRIDLATTTLVVSAIALPVHAPAFAQSVDRNVEREEGSVSRTITAESADGRTATLEQQVNRTENGATKSSTLTNGEGRSAGLDRFTEKTETGRQGGATFTGPEGQTASRASSRSYVEGEGYTRDHSVMRRDGKTATRNASGNCADSTCSRERTTTGFEGQTRNVRNSATRNEDGSVLRQRSVTSPGGETRKRERTRRGRSRRN